MAWYNGTYSCGHEGRVNVIGPMKDRQWKIDREFGGLCPECYEKKKKEEQKRQNREAAERSSKMELPELSGTEKQVAWANTLRIKVIEEYEKRLEKAGAAANSTEKDEVINAMDLAIKTHTDAKFWIESRDDNGLFRRFMKEYLESKASEDIPEDVKEEIGQEGKSLTVMPETEDKKGGVAVISFAENDATLSVKYPKDDQFREIVKELGYLWSGTVWEKKIDEYTGTATERAAELGNELLSSGFTVRFPNEESKVKAINADFSEENDRWVKYNKKNGELAIVWGKRSDTLYESAKKISGARWKDGRMNVSLEFYQEVEDFSETLGFSISKKAMEKIEEYKKKEAGFERAEISAPTREDVSDEERIARSLRSNGTIIEDLVDE